MPVRKRTALVDQRISRSSLSGGEDPQHLLEQQHALANPSKATSPPSSLGRSNVLGLGAQPVEEPAQHTRRDVDTRIAEPIVPPKTEPVSLEPQSPEVMFQRPITPEEPAFERPVSPDEPPFNRPSSPDEPPFRRPVSPDEPSFQPPTDRASGFEQSGSFSAKPRSGAATPTPREDFDSSTASILDSMDQSAPADEQTIGGGQGGLKRNTSAEVSRLRGPRGARGPRPAPGRVMSGQGIPPATSVAPPTPVAIPEPEADVPSDNERSGGVGVPGDYAPRRGKGATSAGAVSGLSCA